MEKVFLMNEKLASFVGGFNYDTKGEMMKGLHVAHTRGLLNVHG